MKNLLKFLIGVTVFLFSFFIFHIFVFATDYTNDNGITYTGYGYVTNDTSISIDVTYVTSSGAPLPVTAGSTYYTEVETMYINVLGFTFQPNLRYQLELHLTAEQLQYANNYSVVGHNSTSSFNCSLSYSDSVFNDPYPRWDFQCPQITQDIIITINNNLGDAITEQGNFGWDYGYLYYSSQQITSGDSSAIINNQNENTQIIIDNQNQNTQDIINNQNNNTDKQIESQKVCNNIDRYSTEEGKYLNNNGTTLDNTAFGVTDYIKLNNTTTIKTTSSYNGTWTYYCFYNSNKTKITCSSLSSLISNEYLTIPGNATYFRSTIRLSENHPTFEICTNGNQALTDTVSNLNDSINDDDIDDATSEASDFFSDFNTNTFGLTSIITAPLNLIQSLTSSSCTSLHLPLPYLDNKYLDLPCMSNIYSQYFGSFFTLYQTITYGIIAYWVCVRIFNLVKDFKNPEHDEIEVVDL